MGYCVKEPGREEHIVCAFFLFVLKFSLDKSTGREGRLVPGNGDKVEWEVLANGF